MLCIGVLNSLSSLIIYVPVVAKVALDYITSFISLISTAARTISCRASQYIRPQDFFLSSHVSVIKLVHVLTIFIQCSTYKYK